ncbi:MAG: cytochrome c biogenesis CcdA family protein [Gammaproteobacteria bacterium]|nr:cytochrome c biogenesis CcdA family protein [Gammaproteobacteria bacterium]MCF6230687.1 cytochrome c biogenesis CcdA family protein [Gammaproteobacteria bacterium]
MTSFFLAYIAGVVTILSPCVLPLLPIILGSSINEHKRGPLFLVAGLIISFTSFGMIVSTIGFSIGLTTSVLQTLAASIMILFGAVLIFNPLYERFSVMASASTSGINSKISTLRFSGVQGQFALGILLGAVWSPCVGPTLGAAITLAAQGESLIYAATIMLLFSIGTSTPILAMSFASQKTMLRMKGQMMRASKWMKPTMGTLFVVVGVMILTGFMITIEETMLNIMPAAMTDFIYRF